MAEASIPVDLTNPGQVFACLGFMEAAEILCGPSEGGFSYQDAAVSADFVLRVDGEADPVAEFLRFLAGAQVSAIAPARSGLRTDNWQVETIVREDGVFPGSAPNSPATLPALLRNGEKEIVIEHWMDGSDRDNVKFWAGAGGYPGAALARDALEIVRAGGGDALAGAVRDPFNLPAQQTSSFRFDWRRDYVALDAGFSPNEHGSAIEMVGYPLVELLAAIGMQHARPARVDPRDNLAYRYGVWGAMLPTAFARVVTGGEDLGFPMRTFRMRLDWPGQPGQARCIVDAQEEMKDDTGSFSRR